MSEHPKDLWWLTWTPPGYAESICSVTRVRDGFVFLTTDAVYWGNLGHDGQGSVRLIAHLPFQ